jgi:hypothetical protein
MHANVMHTNVKDANARHTRTPHALALHAIFSGRINSDMLNQNRSYTVTGLTGQMFNRSAHFLLYFINRRILLCQLKDGAAGIKKKIKSKTILPTHPTVYQFITPLTPPPPGPPVHSRETFLEGKGSMNERLQCTCT